MLLRISHAFAAALTLVLVGSAIAPAQNPGDFPYVAYVLEPDTYIRSGPAREHYPTGQLPAGFAVEVYRHDPGGWCAIRPPEGSFSLVPVHQLRIIDQRTAEVAADGVVARVGSALGSQRNSVQVLLERGEAVQLLEPVAAGATWVRIAPPAGEFRWIAARRLSRVPPMEAVPQRPTTTSGWQAQASGRPLAKPADATPHVAHAWPAGESTADEDFSHLNGSPAGPPSDEVEILADSPAAVRLTAHETEAAGAATPNANAAQPAAEPPALIEGEAPTSSPPRVRFRGSSTTANLAATNATAPAGSRAAELQIRLSQAVVQAPSQWRLAPLREETAALLAKEQDAAAREDLRDLLDRIATFETIQSRYAAVPTTPTPLPAPQPALSPIGEPASAGGGPTSDSTEVLARVQADLGRTPAPNATAAVTPTPGAPAAAPTEPLYDAVGTLKPVVSRRQNAPRYALVDDHGDVVTFVTATPDVNLQPFVGQRIGVRGSRGFMPEYRRAHVTATRITPLEEKLVR
jgi:hypothetical protein